MRDYAKVSPLFWTGTTGREIKKRGQVAQLAALYLMTSPGATMLGVYHLPAVFLAHAIGSPSEGALQTLQSLSEVGFCVYDENSEWVWVKEMAAWQIDDSLARDDNRVKGVAKDWLALPNLPFLFEFYDRYAKAFHLPSRQAPTPEDKPLGRGFEAPPKPGAGTGTREKKKDSATSWLADSFADFWKLWPKHVAKAAAWKAWRKLEPDAAMVGLILAAVRSQSQSAAWLKDGGTFIPHPATWLNGRRWEDEGPRTPDGPRTMSAAELAP